MSYDLAVWTGPPPIDERAAFERYRQLLQGIEKGDEPPAPAIVDFVDELLNQLPDDPDHPGGSPWAGPPLEDAVGDLAVLSFTGQDVEIARSVCARLAADRGLVCFDPQIGSIVGA